MNRSLIMEKDGHYGLIILDQIGNQDILSITDTRGGEAIRVLFDSPREADLKFVEARKLSIKNGWLISYDGERNSG